MFFIDQETLEIDQSVHPTLEEDVKRGRTITNEIADFMFNAAKNYTGKYFT